MKDVTDHGDQMELTSDWRRAAISELAELVSTGPFGSLLHKRDYISDGIPVINPVHLIDGRIRPNLDVTVSRDVANRLATYRLQTGDILVARRGDIGRCGLVLNENEGWICGTGCFFIRPKKFVDPRFLTLLLGSPEYRSKLEGASTGTTMLNLGNKALAKLQVHVPPLEDQKRIVAVLDQAFAALDRARAHAEANLEDAVELFDAELNKVFGQPPANWHGGKLGDICSKIGSGATPRGGAEAYKSEGISLIRSLNVYDRDFRTAKLAFIDDAQAAKLSSVIVKENDVLFNITGASIARCCMVDDSVLPARVNQHVAILRPDKTRLLPAFLTLFMTASDQKKRLLETGAEGGATRQAITKAQLQSLSVRFPADVRAQQEVIEKLQFSEIKCREVAASYRMKLDATSDLRQSLLQKAFSGQLTA